MSSDATLGDREATRLTLATMRIGGSLAGLVAGLRGRIGADAASRERAARVAMACGFTLLMEDLGVGERWLRGALARGWRADEVGAGWRATAGLSPFARHLFADGEGLALQGEELRALAEMAERLRVSKWEFGGEGECGAVRWAAAEPTVGGSWHGRGCEGKRAHDEVCGAGPERGSEDGSKAQAGEHVAGGARGQANNRTCVRQGSLGEEEDHGRISRKPLTEPSG